MHAVSSVVSDSLRLHRLQPARLRTSKNSLLYKEMRLEKTVTINFLEPWKLIKGYKPSGNIFFKKKRLSLVKNNEPCGIFNLPYSHPSSHSMIITNINSPQSQLKTAAWGNFLVVQWLRLHTPNAGGLGLISGQGTRSYMLQ